MNFPKKLRSYHPGSLGRVAIIGGLALVVAVPMFAQSAGPMGGTADGAKSAALYIADALAICAMVYGGYKALIDHHAGGIVTVIMAVVFMVKAQSWVDWIKSFHG